MFLYIMGHTEAIVYYTDSDSIFSLEQLFNGRSIEPLYFKSCQNWSESKHIYNIALHNMKTKILSINNKTERRERCIIAHKRTALA